MENELVKVITESGVEESTALTLKSSFLPFFEQAEEWKQKAESLIVTDVSQVREMQMARTARLALRDIRIEADKKRKALKEDTLRYGKAVQGVYNVIEFLIAPIEKHLENQEKFAEVQEAKMKDARLDERLKLIVPLEIDLQFIDLRNMPDEHFQKFYEDQKAAKEAREQAIKQAEIERLAKEKADAEERERIRIENEKLKAEREKREKEIAAERERVEKEKQDKELLIKKRNEELKPYIIFIRDFGKMISLDEPDYQKEFADIKIGAEQHWEYERKKIQREAKEKQQAELRAKKEREATEAKLKAEREEKEKLERQIKAKADAEERAKKEAEEKAAKELKERQEAEKKAAKAPDKIKLIEFAKKIDNLSNDIIELKTEEGRKVYSDALSLLSKVSAFIREKAEQL